MTTENKYILIKFKKKYTIPSKIEAEKIQLLTPELTLKIGLITDGLILAKKSIKLKERRQVQVHDLEIREFNENVIKQKKLLELYYKTLAKIEDSRQNTQKIKLEELQTLHQSTQIIQFKFEILRLNKVIKKLRNDIVKQKEKNNENRKNAK